jgi:4-azaleucine resistance transporter AzlC
MSGTPPHREFLAGMRDQLPLLLGVVPFGLIFGALAISAGVPPLAAQAFSLVIFAGSAQFIAATMVEGGALPGVIVFTILIVNLRHALYSASLAPHLAHLPRRWKLALSWLLTDEAFGVGSARYRSSDLAQAHWYLLGTGMTLWASWQVSTALGIALGTQLPENLPLDFALPLTFLALLQPTLVDRPSWAAALAGGLLSVLLAGLPFKLGLVLASVTAVGVGLAVRQLSSRREVGGDV